ncbi:MAG: M43 family zinc metalloprotease, partial [Bacteroidota bacterium]
MIQEFPQLAPEINPSFQYLEQFTKDYIKEGKNGKGSGPLTIPVVVHVVHDNGPENLSDEDVAEGIVRLNEDFQAANASIPQDIHPSFLGLVADIEVTFQLACIDPHGNPTNGITRHRSMHTYKGENIQMKEETRWPREKYLNIWIVRYARENTNTSGFAFYPSSVDSPNMEAYDGIVMSYWAYGRHAKTAPNYEGVLTHEAGHWANLIHTWGPGAFGESSSCNDDDGVGDTPNTFGHWFPQGCDLNTHSCGSLDNNNNFMDYTGACQSMFTMGQRDRMRAAIESPVAGRSNLWSATNLSATVCPDGMARMWYTPPRFQETIANDGTIQDTVWIHTKHVSFSQSSGTFSTGVHYALAGLPAGLTPVLTVLNDSTAALNLSGVANSHGNVEDTVLAITFQDAAFSGLTASDVFGTTHNRIECGFYDPYQIKCIDLPNPSVEVNSNGWTLFSLDIGRGDYGTWIYDSINLKLETYSKQAICFEGTRSISPLPGGQVIRDTTAFISPGPFPDQLDVANDTFIDWRGKMAYIGIKIENLGQVHYGWLRGHVSQDGNLFVVLDGAYNEEPDAPIAAGDCGNGVNPQLMYYPLDVEESASNIGQVEDTISIFLENTALSKASGLFSEGTDYSITGLPDGLTTELFATSLHTLSLVVKGTANLHAEVNNTTFDFSLLDPAVNGGNVGQVFHHTQSISLIFRDPYEISCKDYSGLAIEAGGATWKLASFSIDQALTYWGLWLFQDTFKLELYGNLAVCHPGTRDVVLLGDSAYVGQGLHYGRSGDTPAQLNLMSNSYTDWVGKEGYIGIAIQKGNDIHYGWFYGQADSAGAQFTVLRGAIYLKPNAPILTGVCNAEIMEIQLTSTVTNCQGLPTGTASIEIPVGIIPPYT